MGILRAIGDLIIGRLRGENNYTLLTDNAIFLFKYLSSNYNREITDTQQKLIIVGIVQLEYYLGKNIIDESDIARMAYQSLQSNDHDGQLSLIFFIERIWRFTFEDEFQNNARLLSEIDAQINENYHIITTKVLTSDFRLPPVPKTELHRMYIKKLRIIFGY